MAAHQNHSAPAAAKPAHSSGAVGKLRALPGWLLKNRLRGGLLVGSVLLGIIGITAAASSIFFSTSPEPAEIPTLAAALAALDAGDYAEARRQAALLRTAGHLSYEELGGPLFVLGAALSHTAAENSSAAEKKSLFALAARYLDESRNRSFPEDRRPEGLWLLGKALHESGQVAKSIPVLRAALATDSPASADIHRLLAQSYYEMTPPKLAEALDHNRLYLAQEKLTTVEREAGILLEAQIELARGDQAASRAALAKITANSSLRVPAILFGARLQIRAGDASRQSTPATETTSPAAAEQYRAAQAALQSLLADEGIETASAAAAQLLQGVCFERLGDTRAARAQFDRVRRLHFGRPESLAATVFLGDLQRQANNPGEALTLYERALAEAGSRETYRNPWLSLAEFESALDQASEDFLSRKDFARALQLAQAMPALITRGRALELQTRVHLAWAADLSRTARPTGKRVDETALAESRAQQRAAGAALEELAKLRITTRFYTDDLSASANHYLAGHGYTQAARVYRQLLHQGVRAYEPEALAGLGESLLALGQTDAALATLNVCRETFPKHPATYRARLLIGRAWEEQGRLAAARQVLSENLYNYGLTPQSLEWQQSLFALGGLQYREGLELETQSRHAGSDDLDPVKKQAGLAILEQSHTLFQDAIQTLTEATERYPSAEQALAARYRIAEAYRQRSKWPRKKLGLITIETTRVALNRQIQKELLSALDEYAALIAALGNEQESNERSPVEQSLLRNCYFGRADALFDLGKYEEAAQAYSAATNRYQHQPESLEAYVQIAACYRRLNRPGEARGTLEQARVVLKRLPADANFTRTTRYDRQEWSDLLTWLATL